MLSITESESHHQSLDKMTISTLLTHINQEDQSVAYTVENTLPAIAQLVKQIVIQMQKGGRLFYIGAGSSGRLGVVDAAEIPPTFGLDDGRVVGVIAGGDHAIRKAVENAEDNSTQAWVDLKAFDINDKDVVIGIAASGTTPYVVGGVEQANTAGLTTGCITCNASSPLANAVKYPIEAVVGPEFVTGSTRMKAGTAQKMILNMLSTATMIQLGYVRGNKMVDMKLSNDKLVDRAVRMVIKETGATQEEALRLIANHGIARVAIDKYNKTT